MSSCFKTLCPFQKFSVLAKRGSQRPRPSEVCLLSPEAYAQPASFLTRTALIDSCFACFLTRCSSGCPRLLFRRLELSIPGPPWLFFPLYFLARWFHLVLWSDLSLVLSSRVCNAAWTCPPGPFVQLPRHLCLDSFNRYLKHDQTKLLPPGPYQNLTFLWS